MIVDNQANLSITFVSPMLSTDLRTAGIESIVVHDSPVDKTSDFFNGGRFNIPQRNSIDPIHLTIELSDNSTLQKNIIVNLVPNNDEVSQIDIGNGDGQQAASLGQSVFDMSFYPSNNSIDTVLIDFTFSQTSHDESLYLYNLVEFLESQCVTLESTKVRLYVVCRLVPPTGISSLGRVKTQFLYSPIHINTIIDQTLVLGHVIENRIISPAASIIVRPSTGGYSSYRRSTSQGLYESLPIIGSNNNTYIDGRQFYFSTMFSFLGDRLMVSPSAMSTALFERESLVFVHPSSEVRIITGNATKTLISSDEEDDFLILNVKQNTTFQLSDNALIIFMDTVQWRMLHNNNTIGLCATHLFSRYHNSLKLNESMAFDFDPSTNHLFTLTSLFRRLVDNHIISSQIDCSPTRIKVYQFSNPIAKAKKVFSVVVIALLSISFLILVASGVHTYLNGSSWLTKCIDSYKNYEYKLVKT